MANIFITGSTASQCSTEAQKRTTKFSGLLNNAFNASGHSSNIYTPSVTATIDNIENYDSVIVGLSPFTSMSSHRIYSALYTLGLALDAGNAKILLDAPDPHLVFKSFRSVISNPSILTKKNYSARHQYDLVMSNSSVRNKIMETIEIVASEGIPTIIPSVPYFNGTREQYGIPESSSHPDLISLNLDSMRGLSFDGSYSQSKYWSSDDAKSEWSKKIEKTVSKPVLPIKRTAYDTEYEYVERLKNSYGFLMPTYKNNLPWWSPNILLSLSSGTPVFSDWKLTESMGYYWSLLPSDAESFTIEDKLEHARAQMIYYLNSTPHWEKSLSSSLGQLLY